MTTPTGTIDLGELTPDGQPELAAPWPVLVRLRRWHSPRRTGRLAGVTAATVLTLLTVAGAAAPAQPVFVPHFAIPSMTNIVRDQQDMYVVEATEPARARVVAYRLADGTARWEVPVPTSEFTGLQPGEGVLLVQSHRSDGSVTTALDTGTGQELWSRPDGSDGVLAGGRYLVSDPRTVAESIDEPPRRELTALDPTTGQPVWTVQVTGWNYATGGADARYLLTYGGADGDLTSYDLTTGERLASASIRVPESTGVQVVGSLALLADESSVPPTLTAYDVATLAPRWTVTDLGGQHVWPVPCGALVCLVSEQPPRAIDPATGELMWSADWFPTTDTTGWVGVSELAGAGLDDHLLLTERPGLGRWLVDAGTGEPVLDLREWHWFPGWLEPADPGAPLLVQHGAERTVVGQLQPDLSGVRALGAIDISPPVECSAVTDYVFCVAGDGEQPRLTVWRHRLP